MKIKLITSIAIVNSLFCFGQSDTIFTNTEKLSCTVKEITQDAVKFSYPGEDLMNSIYKNAVIKIIFKNGRIQTFAEATSFKKINGAKDFGNVTISQVESEVKGLFKVGDVSSKAKGTTSLSNQERVKERAYKKLKIQAAMQGANIIYLTSQRTEGNKQGGYFQSSSSAETNLTGIAYTNTIPNFNDFMQLILDKRTFEATYEVNLWSSASDLSENIINKKLSIRNIINENGLIIIDGKMSGDTGYIKYRVVSFSKDNFNIYYEDKNTNYNLTIKM